ncbi:hypothetical protein K4039_24070 [Lyngbya sp. CCAP 1446/10]|uniref:hypothetical protein n=1 Tax=Lyngbya sp. CCAP 1446/10 TaxID=439293 RepID=UPI002237FA38|nr:hypothetical protein [Lyngbya sp. CCAP 1446/10]MCW6053063.1 hypothetical protein [Lyngbya sp. CCAP 1446/10]
MRTLSDSSAGRSIAPLTNELAQLRRYEKAITKVQDPKTASLKASFADSSIELRYESGFGATTTPGCWSLPKILFSTASARCTKIPRPNPQTPFAYF